jgi:hypothetical protein
MSVILREPVFIRQKKANSCWFACVKMLLEWHEGDRSINNQEVSKLASWITPRRYDEIPTGFLQARNIVYVNQTFRDTQEIEAQLLKRGPFVGGGTVGKFFVGKRRFGHAILIYGVMPSGHVLHHDPTVGPAELIKGSSYIEKQDGERLHYHSSLAKVEVRGIGS